MTNRRAFLVMIAGGFLAGPLAAEGQQVGKALPRIGFLGYAEPKSAGNRRLVG